MTTISWVRSSDGTQGKTWNVVTGCDRTSPGCDNCYALKMAGRLKLMGQAKYQNDGDPRTSGPGFGVTCHPDVLDVPLQRRKPTMWFVCSMADLFHRAVPEKFIEDVWDVMADCPQHTFQVLTKRPQRMAEVVRSLHDCDCRGGQCRWCAPHANIWLGTSIESDRYTFRADHLRWTPAAVRFLSLEPLLGPLPSLDLTGIDWTIIGGESGPGARPMELEWAVDLIDQCRAAGVACFFKQTGTVLARERGLSGKGEAFDELPPVLQVREWPS